MKSGKRFFAAAVVSAALCGAVAAQSDLTDPYVILNRSFDAQGGLERLKADTSSYAEGILAVAGLTGPMKVWSRHPDLQRSEVDLKVLKITQGDNGRLTWTLDSNGKVQVVSKEDRITTQRRAIRRGMADYRHADPASDLFAVALRGQATVNGQNCYAIVITNTLNADTLVQYVNAKTFLLEASDSRQGDKGAYTTFGDYRRVDGLAVAFYSKQKAHNTGQEQEMTLAEYRSNPAIDAALFEPPEGRGKDFRFVEGDRSENVPFRFIDSHLFVPVIVECKERLWILDTGAGITVISRKFAGELGIESRGDMQGAGAGGNVTVAFATLPAFSVKGIEFDAQQVAVIDMDELNRMIGFETAGILGFDFLSRFVTRIDYANELLSFYDPDTYSYSGGGTPLDAHIKGSTFEVQASLDGRATGTWLFDIGATGISMETPHALRLGYGDRRGVIGLGAGAGATFESKRVACDSIALAGFTILKPRMDFIVGASGAEAAPDKLGLLGNRLFGNFVVYCDYKNERVVLEKGPRFNQPWPEDHSGLQLVMNADWKHIDVHYVQAGTPAQKAGFKAGDRLTSINGIDLECFDGLNSVRRILAGDVGRKLDVVVTRDGRDTKLKMVLADLYAG